LGIAGVCDASGRILGMMPHPENAVVPWQHPRWTREHRVEGDGLAIFRNGIAWVNQI
jgi:phosphoribosylformylglycinamidine synthase